MIPTELALTVSCPKCGAPKGSECRGIRRAVRTSEHGARVRRALDERDFWRWVDQQLSLPENADMSEQQFLDSIRRPGYMGRKARIAAPAKVLAMPARDFRMAAAGDDDEAA